MNNKTLLGIMTIIFNSYGVPCFMQGHVQEGVLRIVLGVVTCGVVGTINTVMGIIKGIQILRMSEEEFAEKKAYLNKGFPRIKNAQ